MTSLIGELQANLPRPDALVACVEAIDRLGWDVETVKQDRIVSYASTAPTRHPPKVEIELVDSGRATQLRIIGTDTEAHPLSEGALIAELDRVQDAIKTSVAETAASRGEGPPPGWYPDPGGSGSRWWDGSRWTDQVKAEPQTVAQRGVLIGLASILILGGLAAGGWLLLIRDEGPSDAERAQQRATDRRGAGGTVRAPGDGAARAPGRRPEEHQRKAGANAAARGCEAQMGDLLTALEDLQSRVGGLGYEEYERRVGNVNSAYGKTPLSQLGSECVFDVGFHAEDALNSFVEAGNVWKKCLEDSGCDIDSIDSELQDLWNRAAAAIRKARQGLADLR